MGKNYLGQMMPSVSADAGLSQAYTNHSVRASCVTELFRQGVPSATVMRISKHKASALSSYDHPSEEDKEGVAGLLDESNAKQRKTASSTPSTPGQESDLLLSQATEQELEELEQKTAISLNKCILTNCTVNIVDRK